MLRNIFVLEKKNYKNKFNINMTWIKAHNTDIEIVLIQWYQVFDILVVSEIQPFLYHTIFSH